MGLYYWNEDDNHPLEVKTEVINHKGESIYNKNVTVNPHTWIYDELPLEGEYTVNMVNTKEGAEEDFTTTVSPETILDINTRYVKK